MTKRETLPNGTIMYTGAGLSITTDSLLLAEFCPAKSRWSLCDLGCGSGILLFSLIDKGLGGQVVGVEQDPHAVSLLQKAAEENSLNSQITAVCTDLAGYRHSSPFDLVVSNPPYFYSGQQAQNTQRAAARHQVQCTIGDVCAAAFRLLKDGGRFCVCWPAEDASTLLRHLSANALEPKRMQWVRRSHQDLARLVLVEAHRHGGPGVKILPDRILPPGTTIHY